MLDVAQSLGSPFPVGTATQHLFTQAIQAGLAKEDYSSVIKVLEAQAGVVVN